MGWRCSSLSGPNLSIWLKINAPYSIRATIFPLICHLSVYISLKCDVQCTSRRFVIPVILGFRLYTFFYQCIVFHQEEYYNCKPCDQSCLACQGPGPQNCTGCHAQFNLAAGGRCLPCCKDQDAGEKDTTAVQEDCCNCTQTRGMLITAKSNQH